MILSPSQEQSIIFFKINLFLKHYIKKSEQIMSVQLNEFSQKEYAAPFKKKKTRERLAIDCGKCLQNMYLAKDLNQKI